MGRTVWFDRWFDQPRNPEVLGGGPRKQDRGTPGVIGLRHRREPVGRGRTGGADQCGWSACPLANSKSEEGSGSLVKNGNGLKADLVFASQDERSGTEPGENTT